jgi:hypothetical protein
MRALRIMLVGMVLVALSAAYGIASEKGSGYESKGSGSAAESSDTAGIQAAMLDFIHGHGDKYEVEGVTAAFDYLHDGVKEQDGYYVSCADFTAGTGVYDLDYYVGKHNGDYSVEKIILHKRNEENVNKILYPAPEQKGSSHESKGSDKGSGYQKKGS